jgi:hypothetical protein
MSATNAGTRKSERPTRPSFNALTSRAPGVQPPRRSSRPAFLATLNCRLDIRLARGLRGRYAKHFHQTATAITNRGPCHGSQAGARYRIQVNRHPHAISRTCSVFRTSAITFESSFTACARVPRNRDRACTAYSVCDRCLVKSTQVHSENA